MCGAVVVFEHDRSCARKVALEAEDVVDCCGAEGIDGLGVVSNDRDATEPLTHAGENVALHDVRVLVLVDEYVVEQPGKRVAQSRRACDGLPQQQKIIEIEHVAGTLSTDVSVEDACDVICLRGAPTDTSPRGRA